MHVPLFFVPVFFFFVSLFFFFLPFSLFFGPSGLSSAVDRLAKEILSSYLIRLLFFSPSFPMPLLILKETACASRWRPS